MVIITFIRRYCTFVQIFISLTHYTIDFTFVSTYDSLEIYLLQGILLYSCNHYLNDICVSIYICQFF